MLKRYPYHQNDPLQAWDAADELILDHAKSLDLSGKRILIINDGWGALSCGLIDRQITVYSDSYVSAKAAEINSENKISVINQFIDLSGVFDLVLIKLPKNMSFLEDILCTLTKHLKTDSKIIVGSMVKHLPKSAFELINQYIGETTTSLAQKKARLIFADFQKTKIISPYPIEVKIESFDQSFTHGSNLFSREKLDIGTRFFLENIPQGEFKAILDLGCANGVVGIKAKKINPLAKIIFSDESAMAIQSAKVNYQKFFADDAEFVWSNCYENGEKNSLDLVLCNPPFHQQNTVLDLIAEQMFKDAFWALKKGGMIRVIGNSHLPYPLMLKKIFGNSKIVATNQKFIIMDAVK